MIYALKASMTISITSILPSAVPIEVFWHVVYSSVCKHLYLYARSRRTSGQPWRPGSGLRPPVPYAGARSSSPVPRASRRPRLLAASAAPIRPCRSEEHTSELQSPYDLVCRLLLEKKKTTSAALSTPPIRQPAPLPTTTPAY